VLSGGERMRTHVYVDGFNLYYQIRATPYRWLNLKLLADHFVPAGCVVERVNYYTAHVSGAVDPNDPIKQQMYLRALKTVPEISTYFGRFLAKPAWRPLLNVPVAARQLNPGAHSLPASAYTVAAAPVLEHMHVGSYGVNSPSSPVPDALKVRVHIMEEKGSDVNIAVHLLNDGWRKLYEAAALISNDTDLIEAVRIVTCDLKLPVFLLCPTQKGAAKTLAAVSTSVRHLNNSILKSAQFPDNVPAPRGWKPINKPAGW
jgi:hypothetical protein